MAERALSFLNTASCPSKPNFLHTVPTLRPCPPFRYSMPHSLPSSRRPVSAAALTKVTNDLRVTGPKDTSLSCQTPAAALGSAARHSPKGPPGLSPAWGSSISFAGISSPSPLNRGAPWAATSPHWVLLYGRGHGRRYLSEACWNHSEEHRGERWGRGQTREHTHALSGGGGHRSTPGTAATEIWTLGVGWSQSPDFKVKSPTKFAVGPRFF